MTALSHPCNAEGHLLIDGADAVGLARTFHTPLLVYDVSDVRRRARAFRAAFDELNVRYQVAYASKALSIVAIYQVVREEGLCVDVVSGGELHTALCAGVPAAQIHFHGNNKSDEELRYALEVGVECFVVDSMREVERLPQLALEVWGKKKEGDEGEERDSVAAHEQDEKATKPTSAEPCVLPMLNNVKWDTRAPSFTSSSSFDAATKSIFSAPPPPSYPRSSSTNGSGARLVQVLLRVAPGVTAHTHVHNTTGQVDSKFGFDIASGQATDAFHRLSAHKHVRVLGLHCHIGSQIFTSAGYAEAARRLMALMDAWGMADGVLNMGGGYGVRYTTDDHPLPVADYIRAIVNAVRAYLAERDAATPSSPTAARMGMPEFWVEPGRSLVSEAGTTLYTVGAQKMVPKVRTYLAVDGGMSDNIRPVTYDAVYSAVIANRMAPVTPSTSSYSSSSGRDAAALTTRTYTVVGKLCESGDQLIRNVELVEAQADDLLAVFCTGAYCYSMASNYNKMCRPAVVFVEAGVARLVVRRETYEDLVRNELPYCVCH